MKKSLSLHYHEWISVVTLTVVLSLLTLISHSCENPKEMASQHYLKDQLVEIYISGAVENPGVYHVARGTTVAQALDLVIIRPTATLKGVKLESKIVKSRHIKIPESKKKKS